eukprot:TRINITY_DN20461_c0_g1_i2.p1 TRINITY_DN20461_c0_g1~~TRINITY_DN20461_c0_g1_i2.p1  ORF type:complete len:553 (+),score=116.02 TRINITY_DN20461_c0_g1_i2:85-1743(+)
MSDSFDASGDLVLSAIRAAAEQRPRERRPAPSAEDEREYQRLVRQVKELQRSGGHAKEQWAKLTDQAGGGVRDPAKHNVAFLREAVAAMESHSDAQPRSALPVSGPGGLNAAALLAALQGLPGGAAGGSALPDGGLANLAGFGALAGLAGLGAPGGARPAAAPAPAPAASNARGPGAGGGEGASAAATPTSNRTVAAKRERAQVPIPAPLPAAGGGAALLLAEPKPGLDTIAQWADMMKVDAESTQALRALPQNDQMHVMGLMRPDSRARNPSQTLLSLCRAAAKGELGKAEQSLQVPKAKRPRKEPPPQAPGDSVHVSPRGYLLVKHHGPLESYHGEPVYCDATGQKNLQNCPDGFWHCEHEDYDVCVEEIEARVIAEVPIDSSEIPTLWGSGGSTLRKLRSVHKSIIFRVPRKGDPAGTPVRLVGRREAVDEAAASVRLILRDAASRLPEGSAVREAAIAAAARQQSDEVDHLTDQQKAFSVGDQVEARGLVGAVELNGLQGHVSGFEVLGQNKGRVLVMFPEPHGERALKPDNIIALQGDRRRQRDASE